MYFYSHAREGRDIYADPPWSYRQISTHTPARGVTENGFIWGMDYEISTHTPARGVTLTRNIQFRRSKYFYSHAREGRDGLHSPVLPDRSYFYSHAREGRDGFPAWLPVSPGYFYSHAREGRDNSGAPVLQIDMNFYSHAREGRDYFIFIGKDEFSISTHTPARGVTTRWQER